MGRIKSVAVKTLGSEMVEKHSDRFSTSFDKNKTALNEVRKIKSKRVRNVVAGYITKKVKKGKKAEKRSS